MPLRTYAWSLLIVTAACGEGGGRTACGIASLAGPVMILDQFSVPQQTLSRPPREIPEYLPIRMAAGPTARAITGWRDSTIIVALDESIPSDPTPGFGVLITAIGQGIQGVMLYPGEPIPGAPPIGEVHLQERILPLIGLRVELTRIEDPRCPLFGEITPR